MLILLLLLLKCIKHMDLLVCILHAHRDTWICFLFTCLSPVSQNASMQSCTHTLAYFWRRTLDVSTHCLPTLLIHLDLKYLYLCRKLVLKFFPCGNRCHRNTPRDLAEPKARVTNRAGKINVFESDAEKHERLDFIGIIIGSQH